MAKDRTWLSSQMGKTAEWETQTHKELYGEFLEFAGGILVVDLMTNNEYWCLNFWKAQYVKFVRDIHPFGDSPFFFLVYSLSSDAPPLHRPRGNSIPVYTPRVRHALNHFPFSSCLCFCFRKCIYKIPIKSNYRLWNFQGGYDNKTRRWIGESISQLIKGRRKKKLFFLASPPPSTPSSSPTSVSLLNYNIQLKVF